MPHPTLIVANKCYSSWSLRPWLLMKEKGLAFDEKFIVFETPEFRQVAGALSPNGKVPCLVDGSVTVWESLAIMEYLADIHPDAGIWPADVKARAYARSIANEMHAGFTALRSGCPMNLGKRFAARDRGPGVAKDVARITAIWREARERFGAKENGPFLFGAFTAADAMYAPVITRFETYSIPVDPVSRVYMDAVIETAGFQEWREAALQEPWIFREDEVEEEPIAQLRQLA